MPQKGNRMDDKLQPLKALLAQVMDLTTVGNVLEWDEETYMPPGGAAARAEQMGTIYRLKHEKWTSDEMGQLLEAAQAQVKDLDPESDDARLVRLAKRKYQYRKRIPTALATELKRTTGLAHPVWVKARAEKDFKLFQPYLEKIFALKRQVAECFPEKDSIYEPLLDRYEPGMKTAQVREVFAGLKRDLVPLVKAIAAKPEIDDAFMHVDYDEH
jgi:carboxypeptidase Taq